MSDEEEEEVKLEKRLNEPTRVKRPDRTLAYRKHLKQQWIKSQMKSNEYFTGALEFLGEIGTTSSYTSFGYAPAAKSKLTFVPRNEAEKDLLLQLQIVQGTAQAHGKKGELEDGQSQTDLLLAPNVVELEAVSGMEAMQLIASRLPGKQKKKLKTFHLPKDVKQRAQVRAIRKELVEQIKVVRHDMVKRWVDKQPPYRPLLPATPEDQRSKRRQRERLNFRYKTEEEEEQPEEEVEMPVPVPRKKHRRRRRPVVKQPSDKEDQEMERQLEILENLQDIADEHQVNLVAVLLGRAPAPSELTQAIATAIAEMATSSEEEEEEDEEYEEEWNELEVDYSKLLEEDMEVIERGGKRFFRRRKKKVPVKKKARPKKVFKERLFELALSLQATDKALDIWKKKAVIQQRIDAGEDIEAIREELQASDGIDLDTNILATLASADPEAANNEDVVVRWRPGNINKPKRVRRDVKIGEQETANEMLNEERRRIMKEQMKEKFGIHELEDMDEQYHMIHRPEFVVKQKGGTPKAKAAQRVRIEREDSTTERRGSLDSTSRGSSWTSGSSSRGSSADQRERGEARRRKKDVPGRARRIRRMSGAGSQAGLDQYDDSFSSGSDKERANNSRPKHDGGGGATQAGAADQVPSPARQAVSQYRRFSGASSVSFSEHSSDNELAEAHSSTKAAPMTAQDHHIQGGGSSFTADASKQDHDAPSKKGKKSRKKGKSGRADGDVATPSKRRDSVEEDVEISSPTRKAAPRHRLEKQESQPSFVKDKKVADWDEEEVKAFAAFVTKRCVRAHPSEIDRGAAVAGAAMSFSTVAGAVLAAMKLPDYQSRRLYTPDGATDVATALYGAVQDLLVVEDKVRLAKLEEIDEDGGADARATKRKPGGRDRRNLASRSGRDHTNNESPAREHGSGVRGGGKIGGSRKARGPARGGLVTGSQDNDDESETRSPARKPKKKAGDLVGAPGITSLTEGRIDIGTSPLPGQEVEEEIEGASSSSSLSSVKSDNDLRGTLEQELAANRDQHGGDSAGKGIDDSASKGATSGEENGGADSQVDQDSDLEDNANDNDNDEEEPDDPAWEALNEEEKAERRKLRKANIKRMRKRLLALGALSGGEGPATNQRIKQINQSWAVDLDSAQVVASPRKVPKTLKERLEEQKARQAEQLRVQALERKARLKAMKEQMRELRRRRKPQVQGLQAKGARDTGDTPPPQIRKVLVNSDRRIELQEWLENKKNQLANEVRVERKQLVTRPWPYYLLILSPETKTVSLVFYEGDSAITMWSRPYDDMCVERQGNNVYVHDSDSPGESIAIPTNMWDTLKKSWDHEVHRCADLEARVVESKTEASHLMLLHGMRGRGLPVGAPIRRPPRVVQPYAGLPIRGRVPPLNFDKVLTDAEGREIPAMVNIEKDLCLFPSFDTDSSSSNGEGSVGSGSDSESYELPGLPSSLSGLGIDVDAPDTVFMTQDGEWVSQPPNATHDTRPVSLQVNPLTDPVLSEEGHSETIENVLPPIVPPAQVDPPKKTPSKAPRAPAAPKQMQMAAELPSLPLERATRQPVPLGGHSRPRGNQSSRKGSQSSRQHHSNLAEQLPVAPQPNTDRPRGFDHPYRAYNHHNRPDKDVKPAAGDSGKQGLGARRLSSEKRQRRLTHQPPPSSIPFLDTRFS